MPKPTEKLIQKKLFQKWNRDKNKIIKFSEKISLNKNDKYLNRIIFFDDYLKKIRFKIKN